MPIVRRSAQPKSNDHIFRWIFFYSLWRRRICAYNKKQSSIFMKMEQSSGIRIHNTHTPTYISVIIGCECDEEPKEWYVVAYRVVRNGFAQHPLPSDTLLRNNIYVCVVSWCNTLLLSPVHSYLRPSLTLPHRSLLLLCCAVFIFVQTKLEIALRFICFGIECMSCVLQNSNSNVNSHIVAHFYVNRERKVVKNARETMKK